MGNDLTSAARRDGTVLHLNARVLTDYPGCEGRVFVIAKITPWATCESGRMVLVHEERDALRTVDGHQGLGLDANWFHHATTTPPADTIGPELHPGPGDGDGPAPAGRAEPATDLPAEVPGDGERRGGRRVGRRKDEQLGLGF